METMTARRRLLNAEFTLEHATNQFVNRQRNRAHHRRRIELMLYAIPEIEREVAIEDRNRARTQLKGFFNGMAQDIMDTYTPNTLRK
jgi:hypothetical protein